MIDPGVLKISIWDKLIGAAELSNDGIVYAIKNMVPKKAVEANLKAFEMGEEA